MGEDEDFTYEKHLELVSLIWCDKFVAMPREEAKQQGCKMLKPGWVRTKNGDKKRQGLLQRTLLTSVRLQTAGSSQQPRAW